MSVFNVFMVLSIIVSIGMMAYTLSCFSYFNEFKFYALKDVVFSGVAGLLLVVSWSFILLFPDKIDMNTAVAVQVSATILSIFAFQYFVGICEPIRASIKGVKVEKNECQEDLFKKQKELYNAWATKLEIIDFVIVISGKDTGYIEKHYTDAMKDIKAHNNADGRLHALSGEPSVNFQIGEGERILCSISYSRYELKDGISEEDYKAAYKAFIDFQAANFPSADGESYIFFEP